MKISVRFNIQRKVHSWDGARRCTICDSVTVRSARRRTAKKGVARRGSPIPLLRTLLAFGATTASTQQKTSLLDSIDWNNCHLIAELSLLSGTVVYLPSLALMRDTLISYCHPMRVEAIIISHKLERVRMYLLDDECDRDIKPLQN